MSLFAWERLLKNNNLPQDIPDDINPKEECRVDFDWDPRIWGTANFPNRLVESEGHYDKDEVFLWKESPEPLMEVPRICFLRDL